MNVSNSQKIFNADCGICLESFEKNEKNCALSKCGPVFHAACINPWLEKQENCPTCRGKSVKPLPTKQLAKLSFSSTTRAFERARPFIKGLCC